MRKTIVYLAIISLVLFTISSCTKDEVVDPNNPLVGLWSVEKDTYKEGNRNMETTFYDEPSSYFIQIKSKGDWIEEEGYLGQEPIVRTYQYELIGNDSILCYTRVPSDGFKMHYELNGLEMILTEKGYREVSGVNIPYTYVRYLYK